MKVYVNNLCPDFLCYLSGHILVWGSDISPSLESLKKRGSSAAARAKTQGQTEVQDDSSQFQVFITIPN